VRDRLGGLHSARGVLESVHFADVEALQLAGDWDAAGALLAGVARRLEAAGADLLLIATNTVHAVAGAVAAATTVPLLHIADPTRAALERDGHARVGLLGTRYTMEQGFYIDRLGRRAGAREEIDLLIHPDDPALPIPAYDTTALHARAAIDLALAPAPA